ncbi:hypothetical protein DL764_005806 [Monosporascus ibericus]|uniref:Clr5 domain-containing protein n=1 Tax=Monosporascus ibericus TaxID=155417 RepID=A0A4Q4TAY5_9PEZI|nr:hypothetical protein DL764_005806 [Monosporascus ibericus]
MVPRKSQFEYKLAKWGVRKNARRDEWQYLRRRMQKREGRISEVTIRGRIIPEHKIRRELQRYTTIPTAGEFRAGLPSPKTPEGDIIRVMSPGIGDLPHSWPSNLPWFLFKDQVPFILSWSAPFLNSLFAPSEFSEVLHLTLGREAHSQLQTVHLIPEAISATIVTLAKSIPEIGGEGLNTQPICNVGDMNSMATQLLVVLLFRLSNKLYEQGQIDEKIQSMHDDLIMHLIEEISKSNSAFLTDLLRSRSHASDAIKEAVYASALRTSKYEIIPQLLNAGVDPNPPVLVIIRQQFRIGRGKASISWRNPLLYHLTGLGIAAYRLDTRLAVMLLEAGATVGQGAHLLDLVAAGDNHDRTVEIAQLLVSAGTEVDHLYTSDSLVTHLSPLAAAIARNNNRLARFFIEKGADTDICRRPHSSYNKKRERLRGLRYGWRSDYLDSFNAGYTALHIAIVAENIEMTDQLLRPILNRSIILPKRALQEIFVTACWAGDLATAEKLLGLDIELNEGWKLGITPLVATAWNPDIQLAESLLRLGAHVDPLNQKLASFSTSRSPSALHVAAFHGNAALVQLLLDRGANLNLRFTPLRKEESRYDWLIPRGHTSPLQFALESRDPATAAILYPQAELLGGELSLAITMENESLISDLLSRAPDVLSSTILEAAATSGNIRAITSFFSSGGCYQSKALFRAVQAAILSKDLSIVEFLSAHRSQGPIDDYEASSLFNSIEREEWRLVHLFLRDPFLPYLEIDFKKYSFEHDDPPEYNTMLRAAMFANNMLLIKEMLHLGYRPRFVDFWILIEDEANAHHISGEIASLIWSFSAPSSMDLTERHRLLNFAIRNGLPQRVREWIPLVDTLNFYALNRAPLQEAAERDNIVLVRLLIHAGAEVNAPAFQYHGITALQAAAARGNLEIATLLIQQKADVNAPAAKGDGRTALEAAAEHGRLDMVHFLLENGANLEGPMRIHYVRAVDFAIGEGHFAVAKYLKEHGAWTDRDQELQDTAGVLDDCHFVYNEETQDWKIRWTKFNKEEDDWYSVAYSDTNTDDDSYSDSSNDTAEYANSSSQTEGAALSAVGSMGDDSDCGSSDGTTEDTNSGSETEGAIPSGIELMDEAMEDDFDLEAFLEETLEEHQVAMPSWTMSWIMELDASAEELDTGEHSAQWGPMLTEGGEGFPETFDENDFWNIQ